MSNLTRFDRDGLELIIDTETGEAFATINAYARMVKKDESTIRYRCKLVGKDALKMAEIDTGYGLKVAEIDTGYGLKVARLIPANLVFKWSLKDCPELAEKMGECGATVYLYQLAGYKVSTTQVKLEQPKLPETKKDWIKFALESEEAREKAELEKEQAIAERDKLQAVIDQAVEEALIVQDNIDEFPGLEDVVAHLKSARSVGVPSGHFVVSEFLIMHRYPLTSKGERISIGTSLANIYRYISKGEEPVRCRCTIFDKKTQMEKTVYRLGYPNSFTGYAGIFLDQYFSRRDPGFTPRKLG